MKHRFKFLPVFLMRLITPQPMAVQPESFRFTHLFHRIFSISLCIALCKTEKALYGLWLSLASLRVIFHFFSVKLSSFQLLFRTFSYG